MTSDRKEDNDYEDRRYQKIGNGGKDREGGVGRGGGNILLVPSLEDFIS